MFAYQPSYDKVISDDLKIRFQQDIQVLEQEGFSFFSLHRETIWPFSVVLFFPVYLMMAGSEFVRVEPPLRITSYHLMYVCKEQATLAYVYGLGCKFYTKFADGTWLVSNTVQSLRDEKVVTLKRESEEIPTEKVWNRHRAKLLEYQVKGLQPAAHLSYEGWVELESRFDRGNAASLVSLGLFWLAFLAWAIYWLVANGISFINTIYGSIRF